MMENIDDYVYDIEVPTDDDDFNLDPGTPKSQTKSAGKFLLPALSPGRRSRNSEDSQISSEDESNGCFQREVQSLDEVRPNPQHTIKTTTSLKDILPAIFNTPPKDRNKESSCEEENCDTEISKYNSAVQYEIHLKTTDWIQVTVRDFKTGKEIMCKLSAPETSIFKFRQELHFIGGLVQSSNSSSILRLAGEHTTWKKNGHGSGDNSKKYHTVKKEGSKLDPKFEDGFWGLRKGHNKHNHESGEQARWLPAISDEAATLAEAYFETKPPKDQIGSVRSKQSASGKESGSLRVKHAASAAESSAAESGTFRVMQSKSEGSAAEKNINRLLEMRQRPRYSAAIKMKPGSAAEIPKSNHGTHTRILGQGVKMDAKTMEKKRRKLLLLWEHTTLDDDYENTLLFAQRACPAAAAAASSSSTDYYPIEEAVTTPFLPAYKQKEDTSISTTTANSDSSLLKTKAWELMEPMEPESPPPAMEPMEPDCPPPAILKYVRVREFLSRPRTRSISKGVKRCSLPRQKGNVVSEDTATCQKGGEGDGQGGGGPPLSSRGAKTASGLKGMATWRPSEARALVMAKLSNEEESSRRVLLAADMCQWEGLSLMDGRVTRLHLSGCSPSLQGSAVLGPELGRMSELERINLNNNKISGPLPLLECLGRLSFLRQLSLSNNQISGSLKNISVLKHLADLDLSKNALTGSIPEELGSLRGLMSLNLSHNKLVGTIPPEMSELFKLCVLNLSNNLLVGRIDTWIGSLKSLQRLNLAHNQLEGSLPAALTRLFSLEYLHLHGNQLRGDIPMDVLTNLNPGIREILLQSNAFHSHGGSDPGTHKEKKKMAPALMEEDKEIHDASQVAAKAAALLVDIKKVLQGTYDYCTVVI